MESQNRDEPQGRKLRPLLIWLLILSALMIWNWYNLWPQLRSNVAIPYSVFIEQIKIDNVNRVHIDADKISGSFVKPVVWPRQTENEGNVASKPKSPSSIEESEPKSYFQFTTVFPQEIGDPGLLSLLEKHKVTVEVKSTSGNWLVNMIVTWLPLVLLFIFFIWMGRSVGGVRGNALSFGKSRPRRYAVSKSAVTFDDVAGADEAKAQLQQEVDFLRNPKKYYEIGARIPRGVLLIGPPGTGKTLMAKAVAGEASVPFFSISASEFVEMFVGVGASRVRDLFNQAKQSAPAIVFIDELDAVARRRGAGMGTVNDEREQTLNQLLVEMDGFDEKEEVIILAATNRPDVLDPALLRPGRFDRHVVMALPDRKGREGILKIHAKRLKLAPDVDLVSLARSTTGMSGADLANLCNEAALLAARKESKSVNMSHFEEALDNVLLGEKRQILMDANERRVIAYHEAGHAIVAWFIPAADEVHKVTIIPRGQTLGVTEQLPADDKYNYSRTYLLARLAVLLGGRTAEEVAIGDITTGAENDLVEATTLARRMVARWGMGNIGLLAFKTFEEQPFLGYELSRGRDYSEATAATIDEEVKLLMEKSHNVVLKLLTAKRPELDNLAQALLREETIDKEELIKILGTRLRLDVVPKDGAHKV
jgi:cell division protease FtsH